MIKNETMKCNTFSTISESLNSEGKERKTFCFQAKAQLPTVPENEFTLNRIDK